MRLVLLGVRGSTPAPGPEYVHYGGHTSCVAVAADSAGPRLLLDAGTGIRRLPDLLDGQPFVGGVLVSHLHWDHVQGLPFCPALDHDGAQVRVLLPAQSGTSGRDLLAQSMSPPAFPISPEGLRGRWEFDAREPGPQQLEGFQVTAFEVAHKGGRTYGYRVDDASGSVAYVPDHAPAQGVSPAALQALRGVDLLVHDAQFLDSERAVADAYGHATVDDALELAQRCGVGSLMLFHHAPTRTDAQLAEIVAGLTAQDGMHVTLARQGDEVRV